MYNYMVNSTIETVSLLRDLSRQIIKLYKNKAIAMMRRKSPRSENIYLIENHCQANISK